MRPGRKRVIRPTDLKKRENIMKSRDDLSKRKG